MIQYFFDAVDGFHAVKIKINTPNLRYYKYNGHLKHKNLLSNILSPVKTWIRMASAENVFRVHDLINQLQNVIMSLHYVVLPWR